MKAAAELAQAILAQEEEEEQNEEERECGHEHKRGADGAACARDAGECARQRDDEQPEKGKKFSRCLRKSLKKSTAESTMPQQSSTDVATPAQPG